MQGRRETLSKFASGTTVRVFQKLSETHFLTLLSVSAKPMVRVWVWLSCATLCKTTLARFPSNRPPNPGRRSSCAFPYRAHPILTPRFPLDFEEPLYSCAA